MPTLLGTVAAKLASFLAGNIKEATPTVPLAERADGSLYPLQADADGLKLGAAALPTGAATSAKQDTGNTSLFSIDGSTADLVPASIYKTYATAGALAADCDLVTDGGGSCRQIVVGTPGTLVLTREDNTVVTIPTSVVSMSPILVVRAKSIDSTSTAQNILVLW